MNTLLLQPTDVLFFRDGRPMGGSLSGHAAAWPLPTVTNAALHAALHRADLEKAHGSRLHPHDHHRDDGSVNKDARRFGSLVTAGPFPVLADGKAWLFPRPLDAGLDKEEDDGTAPTLLPLAKGFNAAQSSLPNPLRYAVANQFGPTKKSPSPWWNRSAWEIYLGISEREAAPAYYEDADFTDTEFSYGIGLDDSTGAQDGERFYSAHYLRLREHCKLGLLASARDKDFRDAQGNDDLIATLFPNSGTETPVIVGGQQRLCTVRRDHPARLPLPVGKTSGFESAKIAGQDAWLVKWVLLSPAIFPEIKADPAKGIKAHPGGWLPNWIFLDWDAEKNEARENNKSGEVLLKTGDTQRRKEDGKHEPREAWRARVRNEPFIPATLVAALVGKPIPVTGYALPHETTGTQGGAKPTHLAVPAGSVYYFTCATKDAAAKLAAALNWHGAPVTQASSPECVGSASLPTQPQAGGRCYNTIRNRRSTLFGEKGFGLGVCGTWQFHPGTIPD